PLLPLAPPASPSQRRARPGKRTAASSAIHEIWRIGSRIFSCVDEERIAQCALALFGAMIADRTLPPSRCDYQVKRPCGVWPVFDPRQSHGSRGRADACNAEKGD